MNAQNDDDPVGLLVNGSNTTVAGNGNAAAPEGIDMEHNVYRQTLRQSPTPKVMHAVDRDAIMAIIEGSDGDDLGSNSDSDCSVTSSGSDEAMGRDRCVEHRKCLFGMAVIGASCLLILFRICYQLSPT